MNTMLAYAVYQCKRSLREPITLGWSLGLPVLLLVLFGGLPQGVSAAFAGSNNGTAPLAPSAASLVMGLIGLNVLSSSIFGVGVVLVQSRAMGILQRLALTPQPAWTFVGGHILAASAVTGLSTLLLLVVGTLLFPMALPQRPLACCAVLALGSVTFLAMGYALAAVMHEVRTMQVVGSAVFFLAVCVSGVWTPLETLPTLARWLGVSFPLSHFVTTLRGVGYLHQPLSQHLLALTVMAAWGTLATGVALWQFRWGQEC